MAENSRKNEHFELGRMAFMAKIESGSPAVSMGNYMQVLMTLGLDKDMLKVALDDELGRKIQDAGLSVRRRASKRGTNK